MKIFIAKSDLWYDKLFTYLGFTLTDSVQAADVLCLTGGVDVNPKLYGEEKHNLTYCDSLRDRADKMEFHQAVDKNIPIVGICRGAQFLAVMHCGTLKQHIDGHGMGTRTIYEPVIGDIICDVIEDHHQAIQPKQGMEVLAVSEDDIIEAAYWPTTRSLGVQFHPEWSEQDSDSVKYFNNLLDTYIRS